MLIGRKSFGQTADGMTVDQYTVKNQSGTTLKVMTYGASITALEAADKDGLTENIVLGFDSISDYEAHDAYFGATIGRVCNRIANGRFTLDGKSFRLATNNESSHLHGGVKGFDKAIWKADTVPGNYEAGIRFSYSSKDGEEGYPGNLDVTVLYTLNNDNDLRIEYTARTDAKTVVNLTNHVYWNLSGGRSKTIHDHLLHIDADQYLAVDQHSIPTLAKAVKGTAMDFTEAVPVGQRLADFGAEMNDPTGYDHCYVLRQAHGRLASVARVEDPASGRIMEVLTTEPGIQLYTGNFLDGSLASGGHTRYTALCLETQHFPDSPNRPDYPSVELGPGEQYQSKTIFRFQVQNQQKLKRI